MEYLYEITGRNLRNAVGEGMDYVLALLRSKQYRVNELEVLIKAPDEVLDEMGALLTEFGYDVNIYADRIRIAWTMPLL